MFQYFSFKQNIKSLLVNIHNLYLNDSIRQGMELGADDYLTKPFSRADLLNAISSRLAKQKNLIKQYEEEHQRAEKLNKRVIELKYLPISQEIFQNFQKLCSGLKQKLT